MSKTDLNKEITWDIKEINISLGGEYDEIGFMKLEIFNDDFGYLYLKNCKNLKLNKKLKKITLEEIPLDSIRRLRDFLNYAIKD